MPKKNYIKDITGRKYGHWIVKAFDEEKSNKTNKKYWICECDCGCGTLESKRADSLPSIKVGGCKKIYSNSVTTKERECLKCKNKFFPKIQAQSRKYCYNCYPEADETNKEHGIPTRVLIKKWSLEYKGNKCQCCGYDKCEEALEFHHINPQNKKFSISDRNLKLEWNIIKEELDKCILVCANCHREIHNKLREI